MKKISIFALIILSVFYNSILSQTDANIVGHIISNGEHIAFANVIIKGTTIGTSTDETGHFRLVNLPVGELTIKVQYVGYKSQERKVNLDKNSTIEINFEIEKDVLSLNEIVVSGNRNEGNKKEQNTIVNTLSQKLLSNTQSNVLSEVLKYSPGLRVENNCQNCGFNQLRMNGLEGPYSQILVNSRQIFSGLAGVYGLELIPANMIERVEVIKGGASALYGSNAIGGTVNIILADPTSNTYGVSVSNAIFGANDKASSKNAYEKSSSFNTSLVSSDAQTGLSLFGFLRDRDDFDANSDGFSELSKIKNLTLGGRLFHRFTSTDRLSIDFFKINEDRRGGDNFELPNHLANISEAVEHDITTGAISYEKFYNSSDLFTIYAASQNVNRNSYYGANQSLADYGNTKDLSYNAGLQYNGNFTDAEITVGAEIQGSSLVDKKLGYYDLDNATMVNGILDIPFIETRTISDQNSFTYAVFSQYDRRFGDAKLSAGIRFDRYSITEKGNNSNIKGNVFSPRISLLYDISSSTQFRLNYAQGFRAPQIFDEDLHIETSGARQVLHRNDPNLTQETSRSFSSSLTKTMLLNDIYFEFMVEGFYTKLENPFVNEYSEPDSNGTVIYNRVNTKDGAFVKGINLEINMADIENLEIKTGFTYQNSQYQVKQEFNEKRFFRTPNDYGFIALNYNLTNNIGFSLTGDYTGKMLVPYFGIKQINPEKGELRESDSFIDMGLKLKYKFKLNGASSQLFVGIKNIFNSYQSDFDKGIDRDPAYIYGPILPRQIYFGIKIGNNI
ncbi:MAG: TonB-dependent receptor [Bacteroidetes bacterium]|nr:TonB-dependent receptor [Bacteroidota bacterium]MBU1114265.1 TonB-dependent receptor [Bacteroidota bacterium]MBU1797671.1 TonB-dependent receptor [Bacteroidota bacterium]